MDKITAVKWLQTLKFNATDKTNAVQEDVFNKVQAVLIGQFYSWDQTGCWSKRSPVIEKERIAQFTQILDTFIATATELKKTLPVPE